MSSSAHGFHSAFSLLRDLVLCCLPSASLVSGYLCHSSLHWRSHRSQEAVLTQKYAFMEELILKLQFRMLPFDIQMPHFAATLAGTVYENMPFVQLSSQLEQHLKITCFMQTGSWAPEKRNDNRKKEYSICVHMFHCHNEGAESLSRSSFAAFSLRLLISSRN